MGLITEELQIELNGRNIKHYENLGYEIPRKINKQGKLVYALGEKFLVKVKDLSNVSNEKVEVKCDGDNCNKELKNIPWYKYKKYVKEDGKYYCINCSYKQSYRSNNIQKAKLKNSKSFEQWCIENNRQDDILSKWDYELNNCKPSEICYSSNKKKYWFKCSRGIHESELKNINSFINGSEGSMYCKKCNSFAQFGIDNICEDFLEKYWDYEKNKNIDPWIITKNATKQKIWIKCVEKTYHGSYPTKCAIFSSVNCRCPYCTNRCGKVHPLDSLGVLYPEVLEIWSDDKNKKSPYDYAPFSTKEVWWKCLEEKHEDFTRSITTLNTQGFRCPECVRERKESFLQEKVRLYLNELNYTLLHEHKCNIIAKNPKSKTNNTMPYDNEVVELKLIIEVMGGQHYNEPGGKWFGENFDLHKRQLYDRYKRIFAKSQGYFYLEIPYWTDDTQESWKKLINDKLSEINNILLNP